MRNDFGVRSDGIGAVSISEFAVAMRESFARVFDYDEGFSGTTRAGTVPAPQSDGIAMAERKHPDWIKVRAPTSPEYFRTKAMLGELKLHSVCQEACCPNIGECFSHRTATFMLMGDVCTRNCPYCAVAHGKVRPLDADEPRRIAEAVARLGLQHVVVTSVDRDDLPDGGAAHFAATAHAIKANPSRRAVEVLVPDFQGSFASVETVVESPVEIYNHNIETVPSLYRQSGRAEIISDRSTCSPRQGIGARLGKPMLTKAGMMLGLGESNDELLDVMRDLRAVECDILTLGQYLRPSADHLPVARYVPPAEFAELRPPRWRWASATSSRGRWCAARTTPGNTCSKIARGKGKSLD